MIFKSAYYDYNWMASKVKDEKNNFLIASMFTLSSVYVNEEVISPVKQFLDESFQLANRSTIHR